VPTTPPVRLCQSKSPTIIETQQCGRAAFEVHHLTSERVCIRVSGDVDATNRQALGHFVERHTRKSHQLVLDLRTVDFFGSQGFTALYYVSVHCARRDVDWVVVANRAVDRILRICDSEAELPVVYDFDAAVHKLDRCAKYRRSASLAKSAADASRSIARAHRQPTELQDGSTPSDCNPGPGDVAAFIGSEQDVHRRKLGGLARPAQRRVLAERSDLLRRHG
jgi:anti-anti-sigma factor